MGSTAEFRPIPEEERRRILAVAAGWAAYNGCPRPRSIRAVLTTRDAAAKVLFGPEVRARPDNDIYLVVVEGEITLHEAVDRGAPRAPTGSWAALIITPPPVCVDAFTLRPAEAAAEIEALGRSYTLTE